MKTFEYRGFDSAGKAHKGLVEALNLKEAREKLASRGVLAERVVIAGRRVSFPADLRALVYRECAALLEAGLPLVKALDVLIESAEMQAVHLLLAGIRDRVKEGGSLADAFAEASRTVSPFERAIIEAAERTATVPAMLERLASFLEEQERLKERIHSALVYPCIVLGFGICVAIVMLGLLLPRASSLLADSQVELPDLTVFMLGVGSWSWRYGWMLLLVLVVGIPVLRWKLHHDEAFRLRWDCTKLRVPLLGRGQILLINLRFSRTLSILLSGGVSLIDAVLLAGRATGNSWVADLAAREAERVRHGDNLSDAVRRIPPLASSLPGWIRVGEASGGLGERLESAGQRYERYWDRFVGRSLALLEPVLILIIGAFVLLVTLAILLPILSLSQAIG